MLGIGDRGENKTFLFETPIKLVIIKGDEHFRELGYCRSTDLGGSLETTISLS